MPRTVLQIYAAAVCFVAVATLAIAIGIVTYSLVGVMNPSFTVHPMSTMPPPNPPFVFAPMPTDGSMTSVQAGPVALPQPSAEDEARRKASALEAALGNEVAISKQSLLRWGITAVIGGLLFFAHWRILRRENGRGS